VHINTQEQQYIFIMANAKQFLMQISWLIVLLLNIFTLIENIEGMHMSEFGPFGRGSNGGNGLGGGGHLGGGEES